MSIRSNYNRLNDWTNGLPAARYALLIMFSSLVITVPLAVAFAALMDISILGAIMSMLGAALGVTISSYFVRKRN